jgi:hypothetical protein
MEVMEEGVIEDELVTVEQVGEEMIFSGHIVTHVPISLPLTKNGESRIHREINLFLISKSI